MLYLNPRYIPGCTEEDCLPIIEKLSGLKNITDFKWVIHLKESTREIKTHTLAKIIKVVSGCDAESLEEIAKVYELVVKAGVQGLHLLK